MAVDQLLQQEINDAQVWLSREKEESTYKRDLQKRIEFINWETNQSFGPNTKIRPVNFSTEHRNMLSNLHAIISKGYLAIEEKHDKLLTSLRTAYAEELNLKKEQTSYSDLLDGLRLSLKGYNIE